MRFQDENHLNILILTYTLTLTALLPLSGISTNIHRMYTTMISNNSPSRWHHITFWINMTTSLPPLPLLYKVEVINTTITQAIVSYQHDITQFLIFTECHTTKDQHSTMFPSHLLNALLTDWHTYSPDNDHHYSKAIPPYKAYTYTFRLNVRLRLSSLKTTRTHHNNEYTNYIGL